MKHFLVNCHSQAMKEFSRERMAARPETDNAYKRLFARLTWAGRTSLLLACEMKM
jgi:hypothetical protein